MSEEQFWKTTPRKLFGLINMHNRANEVNEEDSKPQPQKMTLEDLRSMQTARK